MSTPPALLSSASVANDPAPTHTLFELSIATVLRLLSPLFTYPPDGESCNPTLLNFDTLSLLVTQILPGPSIAISMPLLIPEKGLPG